MNILNPLFRLVLTYTRLLTDQLRDIMQVIGDNESEPILLANILVTAPSRAEETPSSCGIVSCGADAADKWLSGRNRKLTTYSTGESGIVESSPGVEMTASREVFPAPSATPPQLLCCIRLLRRDTKQPLPMQENRDQYPGSKFYCYASSLISYVTVRTDNRPSPILLFV